MKSERQIKNLKEDLEKALEEDESYCLTCDKPFLIVDDLRHMENNHQVLTNTDLKEYVNALDFVLESIPNTRKELRKEILELIDYKKNFNPDGSIQGSDRKGKLYKEEEGAILRELNPQKYGDWNHHNKGQSKIRKRILNEIWEDPTKENSYDSLDAYVDSNLRKKDYIRVLEVLRKKG